MREGSFFDILTLVLGVDLVGGCLLGRGLFFKEILYEIIVPSSDLHSKLPTKIVPSLPGGAWSEQVHLINSLTHLYVSSASTAFQMKTMVLEAEQTSLLCRKFFTPQEQKVQMSLLMLLMPRENLFAAMGLFCAWLLIIKTPTPVFLEPGMGFQVFS